MPRKKARRKRKAEPEIEMRPPLMHAFMVDLTTTQFEMLTQLQATGLYGDHIEDTILRIIDRFLWEYCERPVFKL